MNIDEMEAGPQMDALIAERVMGEARPSEIPADALDRELAGNPVKSEGGSWVCRCEFQKGDEGEWEPLPFSTDIKAAWEVIKKIGEWDFSKRLKFANELDRLVCIRKQHQGILIHLSDILIYMEPEDICRAALKAIQASQDVSA
jgi:hypothetical protein